MTTHHLAALLCTLAITLACAWDALGQSEAAKAAPPSAGNQLPSPWGTPVRMGGRTSMKVFVYKQADPQPLRLWAFFPEGWKASDKRAGMVFFCGGAWSHADHNEFVPWANYLASRGMVTGVAEYRPKGVLTCDEDATSAIRWFRAHSAELGVDPKRIGASGGSAGGQMAAYAATCEPRNSPNEDLSVSAKPDVLVLFDAVLDMNIERAAGRLSGQDKASVSPIDHMAKDTVPTLLFYGTECPFVGQARAFLAKSKTMGNRVQLYTAPGGGHIYYFRQPWRELTFGHMDEFLVSLGYLNGPATAKVDTDLKHTNENVSPPATGQPQAPSAPIEKAGGKPKYTEYPTAEHADAWGKAFAEKDLLEWLFAQKRSSAK